MTRRKEIELAWFSKAVQSNHRYDERSFKEAVEWADKTMIEKVTQWLYNHLTTEYHGAVLKIVAKEKGLMPVEFVKRFKKAMLEEE